MVKVEQRENENINSLYRRFKNKVKNEDIMKTIFENRYFEKPSKKRRRERGLAKIRKKAEKRERKKKRRKRTRQPVYE